MKAAPEKNNRVWRRWDDKKKRWVAQPLGINKLKAIPKMVALFLHPDQDASGYRGHSWRPSGATSLAAHGGSAAQLQAAGHWASLGVAQQYIHTGPAAKVDIANVLAGPDSQPEDTAAPQPTSEPPTKKQRPHSGLQRPAHKLHHHLQLRQLRSRAEKALHGWKKRN